MLLDIAFGIAAALVFAVSRHIGLTFAVLAIHIIFALLPDADFLFQWVRRKDLFALDSSHRNLLHNPLIYVPVGAIAVGLWDGRLAWSFIAVSLLHFLHDSVGIGWGVRWLYPFSKRSYKFFSEHDGRFSWNFLTSWTPEEYPRLEELRKERWKNSNWIREIYLKPHPINIIELLGFLFAIALLAHYLLR